ncbi:Transcriptional regulatory protein [Croceitalea dokdonensis DOKDO 023]|uniref:Transcriptional regulatory protein n=1 Tax=Croceitalea dokdonensis DOKDO 023 TaxID=1300341 RepID=A0A0P7ANF1_9FLAO|nr:GntR family transcriptional regulator [Croceitalea dokdonensis]KPM33450.1 Transcriptional regulatory protein [Croceitalea dokdonensis DOKDO 023]
MAGTKVLRNQVKRHLLEQIRRQELRIGKTINLAKLAREIGISVTPIREALSQLEQSRIVVAVPNRGFLIPELSLQEATNLYETVAQLEVLALEQTTFDQKVVGQLKRELLTWQASITPTARLASRVRFHDCLISNCPNQLLISIIKELETRIVFYEQLLITDPKFYEQADQQNEAIVSAIEEDNKPTAALILKMNWMGIAEHIKSRLLLDYDVQHYTIEPNEER